MPTYLPTDQVRLENTAVRPGSSPNDILFTIIPGVTLSSSLATLDISSHINHGEVVSYWFAKQATSTFNGTTNIIGTAAAVAGASAVVDIVVMYRANKAQ